MLVNAEAPSPRPTMVALGVVIPDLAPPIRGDLGAPSGRPGWRDRAALSSCTKTSTTKASIVSPILRPPRACPQMGEEDPLRHFDLRLLLVKQRGPPKEATRCQRSAISPGRLPHKPHQG